MVRVNPQTLPAKEGYTIHYLTDIGTRWCYLSEYGSRDRIQLTTKSGLVIERTAQYYEYYLDSYRIMISYKGSRRLVKLSTVLED